MIVPPARYLGEDKLDIRRLFGYEHKLLSNRLKVRFTSGEALEMCTDNRDIAGLPPNLSSWVGCCFSCGPTRTGSDAAGPWRDNEVRSR